LSALAPLHGKPLQRQPTCDIGKPLLILFAAYEPSYAPNATEALRSAQVAAYQLGMDGLPQWAVQQAVTEFIQGKVERPNRSKLPTAEQIAAQARVAINKEQDAQARERERVEQQEEAQKAREQEEFRKTPEGQAEMAQRRERAAAIMARAGYRPME
jgi:hypothetical protein